MGWVAVVVNGHPEIFPVNYLPDAGSVVFRTGRGNKLDAIMTGQPLFKGIPERCRTSRICLNRFPPLGKKAKRSM